MFPAGASISMRNEPPYPGTGARVKIGFEAALRLIGVEHVGFGADTMFGDHVGLHRAYAKQLSIDKILGSKSLEAVEYLDGLENPADFPNIIRWLVRQDYADADIAKVIGGNALRVLKQVWIC